MKKQFAYIPVARNANISPGETLYIASERLTVVGGSLCREFLTMSAMKLKETEAYVLTDTDLESIKAGLEPLEPFTPEFLSMMLSLGISRLTTAQRYALADGLLERLPERINNQNSPEEE